MLRIKNISIALMTRTENNLPSLRFSSLRGKGGGFGVEAHMGDGKDDSPHDQQGHHDRKLISDSGFELFLMHQTLQGEFLLLQLELILSVFELERETDCHDNHGNQDEEADESDDDFKEEGNHIEACSHQNPHY